MNNDGVDLLCSQLLDLLGGLCEQALEVGGEGAHLVNQQNHQESVISKLRWSGQKIVVQLHEKQSEIQHTILYSNSVNLIRGTHLLNGST